MGGAEARVDIKGLGPSIVHQAQSLASDEAVFAPTRAMGARSLHLPTHYA